MFVFFRCKFIIFIVFFLLRLSNSFETCATFGSTNIYLCRQKETIFAFSWLLVFFFVFMYRSTRWILIIFIRHLPLWQKQQQQRTINQFDVSIRGLSIARKSYILRHNRRPIKLSAFLASRPSHNSWHSTVWNWYLYSILSKELRAP